MFRNLVPRIAFALEPTITGLGRSAGITTQIVVAILAARMVLCTGSGALHRLDDAEAFFQGTHAFAADAPRVRS